MSDMDLMNKYYKQEMKAIQEQSPSMPITAVKVEAMLPAIVKWTREIVNEGASNGEKRTTSKTTKRRSSAN